MTKSLNGLRILNTRPREQAQVLNKKIIESGGIPIDCPTMEIVGLKTNWINKLPDLASVNQAIFVSPNAVRYLMMELSSKKINWPNSIRVTAIGKSTARMLNEFNIQVSDIPELPDSEHLLTLNSLQQIKNQTILLVKGEGGRQLIEEYLMLKGATLCILSVYKRVMPSIDQEFLNSLWRDDLVDIILLTSEQSIHNLFKMFSIEGQMWLQNKPCLVISERLAKVASLFGIKKILISHPERMIGTLFDYKD
ncbi:TPA: uroporphyrinogen-III synthase [Legionella pneumophila]|jgi:uroporphyrinogen-III synthase|uniref:Uroporphyrinogen-III synthase n=1 Tax=Legionella pneumophila TaxID=446 RepID=A0AAN5KS38_LEGPN|nr:uroporphyrinogen-III synthase [Legionella pneumophila]HAT1972965.1 uroporphyrinogen-III synthase [Legionella pneumophila]HAT6957638.1 uroporphyrinogen-III synthase [Legionella pneumophila]HBC0465681.1 uroporphyrinogen-III synthase [Legionella pneumophila]HEN4771106.1 uroporphyrinogen-III synthase [Legionella pneumophila]